MIAPIWLAGTMLAYCLWVVIHDISVDFRYPIYGALPTILVYLCMQICSWYPMVLCVAVETAAIVTFIYHIVNNRR